MYISGDTEKVFCKKKNHLLVVVMLVKTCDSILCSCYLNELSQYVKYCYVHYVITADDIFALRLI